MLETELFGQAAGQTWDPFRPAKPPALESGGAKLGPAQPSVGRGSATYARHRPNQLVRASLNVCTPTDGRNSGQVEAHKITSAPVPVSSSTVSNALGEYASLAEEIVFLTFLWMDKAS